MSKFRYGFLHHVTNTDFYRAIRNIEDFAKEAKITDEGYQEALRLFVEANSMLIRISNAPFYSRDTDAIRQKVRDRKNLLRSIQLMVKGALLGKKDEETLKHAETLEFWLYPYEKEFYHPLMMSHNDAVAQLQLDAKKDPKVVEALRYFSLEDTFEMAVTLSDEIMRQDVKRTKDTGSMKKSTLKWRKTIMEKLKDLLFILEFLAKTRGDNNPVYPETVVYIRSELKEHERIYRIKKGMRQGRKERERLKSIAAQEADNQSDVQSGAQSNGHPAEKAVKEVVDTTKLQVVVKNNDEAVGQTKSQMVAQTKVEDGVKPQNQVKAKQSAVQLKPQEAKQTAKDVVASAQLQSVAQTKAEEVVNTQTIQKTTPDKPQINATPHSGVRNNTDASLQAITETSLQSKSNNSSDSNTDSSSQTGAPG